jgi:hypothetical protein
MPRPLLVAVMAGALVLGLSCTTPVRSGHRTSALEGATLHHYLPPAGSEGGRVVVVPELGFSHRLVEPLCERLRRRGFELYVAEAGPELGSFDDWTLAVARTAHAAGHGAAWLALGVGGGAAYAVAGPAKARGLVAVNVPGRFRVSNVALADALARDLFDPAAWLRAGQGTLLLGGGRSAPREAEAFVAAAVVALSPALARDVGRRYARGEVLPEPGVPLRVVVSVKDNVVHPEDALAGPGERAARIERLGRIEYFDRDYGHLDGLAPGAGLDELASLVADALGALP